MPVQRYLIPGRFIVTTGHIVAFLLVFQIIQNNINATLGSDASDSEKDEAKTSALVSHRNICLSLLHHRFYFFPITS